jgi:hypothetical protein
LRLDNNIEIPEVGMGLYRDRNRSRSRVEDFGLSRIVLIGDGSRHEWWGRHQLTIPPKLVAEMTPALRAFVEVLAETAEITQSQAMARLHFQTRRNNKPTDGKLRPWAMKNDGGAIG